MNDSTSTDSSEDEKHRMEEIERTTKRRRYWDYETKAWSDNAKLFSTSGKDEDDSYAYVRFHNLSSNIARCRTDCFDEEELDEYLTGQLLKQEETDKCSDSERRRGVSTKIVYAYKN